MKDAMELLRCLGVVNCTDRHMQAVKSFIEADNEDYEKLLNYLGSWDMDDLNTLARWDTNYRLKKKFNESKGSEV